MPPVCDRTKDIFDSQGKYAKTICHVKSLQSQSIASATCQSYSMALVNPNEIVEFLKVAAAYLYPNGGRIWLNEVNGLNCTALQAAPGTSYIISRVAPCDSSNPSFCEYNSIFLNLLQTGPKFLTIIYF